MMNNNIWKNIGVYAAIIAVMLFLSYAYMPELLYGKIVNQADIGGWRGMAQETIDWNSSHPEDPARWTDSMFGGMPNVTFTGNFKGDWTEPVYNILLWGKRPASYIFIALLGAFLMMLSLGISKFLALIGAIAVAFCAYNFQIIQVGHNTKMQAIAFAPWALAAFFFTYRVAIGAFKTGKWLPLTVLGSVLFGLTLSMQVKANHVQITYYLAIIIFFAAISILVWVLLQKDKKLLGRFGAASALLLVVGVVGIATNANKLIPIYQYTPFTMRGGSELRSVETEEEKDNGLDLGYATAWSYGIEETPNLMIPNFNGGSSTMALGEKSATWQLFKNAGVDPSSVCSSLPMYWGPQPFTAGPMYIGAVSLFLFILGLFLVEGKHKWWMFVCTVFAIMLAWGNHLMWLTELMFKYAPMYNKFRTVSMALVTLQFIVPLLGVYALNGILKENYPRRRVVSAIWWSMGISAGFCLVSALFPSFVGDFRSPEDSGLPQVISDALAEDRRHLLQLDALRSFLLIVGAAAFIMWSCFKEEKAASRTRIAVAAVGVLVLVDLWSVDKRYLNASHFTTPKKFASQFSPNAADTTIFLDKSISYRVLDLAENTFNSSRASYHHKSIGGYSPTKMQRYQDLIDRYLSKEIVTFSAAAGGATTLADIQAAIPYLPVLSMLNDKYIIVNGTLPPVINPYAFGPAWLVGETVTAETPDAEISLLDDIDLRKQAVLNAKDIAEGLPVLGADAVAGATDAPAHTPVEVDGSIEMTSYSPNEVRYNYSSSARALAVFSEIYHPSWTATLNGEPLELMRCNWVLRCANLPAGEGEIVMRFEPKDYIVGERISRAGSILLVLLLISSVAGALLRR